MFEKLSHCHFCSGIAQKFAVQKDNLCAYYGCDTCGNFFCEWNR